MTGCLIKFFRPLSLLFSFFWIFAGIGLLRDGRFDSGMFALITGIAIYGWSFALRIHTEYQFFTVFCRDNRNKILSSSVTYGDLELKKHTPLIIIKGCVACIFFTRPLVRVFKPGQHYFALLHLSLLTFICGWWSEHGPRKTIMALKNNFSAARLVSTKDFLDSIEPASLSVTD
jgi:hypothetical protein